VRVEIASEDEDVLGMLVPYDVLYRDFFTRDVVRNVRTEKYILSESESVDSQ